MTTCYPSSPIKNAFALEVQRLGNGTQMTGLVKRFREVLDTRREILECFCTYGVQLVVQHL